MISKLSKMEENQISATQTLERLETGRGLIFELVSRALED